MVLLFIEVKLIMSPPLFGEAGNLSLIPYSMRRMQQRKADIPVLKAKWLRRQPALGSQTVMTSKGRAFDIFVEAPCCHSFEFLYLLSFFFLFLNGGRGNNCYALCQVNLKRLLILITVAL